MNGTTFVTLSRSGNVPWLKDRFIISLKGFENSFLNNFKILVGILFGPLVLFVFVDFIRPSMSSGNHFEKLQNLGFKVNLHDLLDLHISGNTNPRKLVFYRLKLL